PSVTRPPKITDRTVPSNFAATPDSNDPSSFEDPMKIWLAAETRPRRCGGVRKVRRVERMTTLTLSTIPLMRSRTSDSQNQCESANRIQQIPNIPTQTKSVGPELRKRR